MEILRRGTVPKKPKYIFECSRCNSKLKCDSKDIRTTGFYRYFECPVCNQRNCVDDYDLARARVFDEDT